MNTSISFRQQDDAFKKVLNERVNAYFTNNGISPNYNNAMVFKTLVMLTLYILPFILILTNLFPLWAIFVLYFVMGTGKAGIGMSVMHDGNHAGYSANQKVNRLMGLTMNLLGADAYNWKIKHNKLHHVFTNIYGKDEDINSRAILRFAFAAPLKPYHKYQHIYAWFFYALMSLTMVFGDISKRSNYRKRGVTNISPKAYRRSMAWLVVSKVLYFGVMFGLPLIFTSMLWWQILIGFLIMHFTTGIILSIVFQMAHVVNGPHQARPDEKGAIPNSLIVHQLKSTADFSRDNPFISWYVGGLNFQVEHHLFPRMCHVHYPAIAKIVETTTREFNLPYYVNDNFRSAFISHYRTLKKLGRVRHP